MKTRVTVYVKSDRVSKSKVLTEELYPVKKSKCICTGSLAKILNKKRFNISETPL